MSIEDDLKTRALEIAEIQKAGGGKAADAASLVREYVELNASYSPRPNDPAKLAQMRTEQQNLLNRMSAFLSR